MGLNAVQQSSLTANSLPPQTSSMSERVPTPVPGAPPVLASQELQSVWVSLHHAFSDLLFLHKLFAKLELGLPMLFRGNESTRTRNNELSSWIFYPGSTGWPGKRCCWTTCWISLPHQKDCCSSNRLEPLTSASPTCSQDSPKNYR